LCYTIFDYSFEQWDNKKKKGVLKVDYTYNSVQLAEEINKRHSNITRDIIKLLGRNNEYKNDFIQSTYTNPRGKVYPCYLISEKGRQVMLDKYRLRISPASLERALAEWLEIFFPNERIERQYPVLGYRIDFYMKDLGICIEYDEKEHVYKLDADLKRQREIQEELKRDYLENIEDDVVMRRKPSNESFPFIRITEGKEVEGIRELLFLIRHQTMSDVVDYMQ
jgi:very-short-patch-repair endonuclease